MRVIAGSARRLKLVTPEGNDTRPTQDRIKETLFNMIQLQVPGSVFIDLYAGSGGIGIEALSRGAKKAYFIDNAMSSWSRILLDAGDDQSVDALLSQPDFKTGAGKGRMAVLVKGDIWGNSYALKCADVTAVF